MLKTRLVIPGLYISTHVETGIEFALVKATPDRRHRGPWVFYPFWGPRPEHARPPYGRRYARKHDAIQALADYTNGLDSATIRALRDQQSIKLRHITPNDYAQLAKLYGPASPALQYRAIAARV